MFHGDHGAFTPLEKRTLLLDRLVAPLMFAWSLNNYRHLLDTICASANASTATPSIIEILTQDSGTPYPCSDPRTLSRTAFLIKRLPESFWSFGATAHPITGAFPNEAWAILVLCLYQVLITAHSVVAPALYVRCTRPWLVMLTTSSCVLALFCGLLTHPTAPPSLYWTTSFSINGVMLLCQHTSMRMEGTSGQVQIGIHLVCTALSMLVLPKVYPHITWPWWSLPLTLLCAGVAWVTLPLNRCSNRVASRANLAASVEAVASSASATQPLRHGRKQCRSSGEEGTAIDAPTLEPEWGVGEFAGLDAQPGTGPLSCGFADQPSSTACDLPTEARPAIAEVRYCEQLTFDDLSDNGDCGGGEDGSGSWMSRSGNVGGIGASSDFASCRIFGTGSSFGTSRERLLEARPSIQDGPAVDDSTGVAEMPLEAAVPRVSSMCQVAVCSSQEELVRMMLTVRSRRYVSRSRPIRIVTKIPDIEPEDLTPDFLLKISASFASHPIHPCMLVGASVRRGCVELVMDLVPMSESSHVSANWDPLSQGHLDPSLWLQHLHVNPPRGTQVLSQACGSVWRSMWDDTQSVWLLSPFPLPATEVPRIRRAPGVIFNPSSTPSTQHPPPLTEPQPEQLHTQFAPIYPLVSLPHSHLPITHAEHPSAAMKGTETCEMASGLSARRQPSPCTASDSPSSSTSTEIAPVVQPPQFSVEVSSFGIVPDLRVRCKGSYLQVSTSMQAVQGSSSAGQTSQATAHAFQVSMGSASLPSSGLLMVECKLGWMVSDSTPVLLTSDALLFAEVEGLLGRGDEDSGAARNHDVIVDLGSWLDYTHSVLNVTTPPDVQPSVSPPATTPEGAASVLPAPLLPHSVMPHEQTHEVNMPATQEPPAHCCASQLATIYRSPAMHLHMGQTGASLLVFAVDNGCTHTAGLILQGLLSVGHSYAWVIAQCKHEMGSMTLLQHAVCSGSSAMVERVISWGEDNGIPWVWDARTDAKNGPSRLQPADDGGALAQRVLAQYSAACSTWLDVREVTDRSSPHDLVAAAVAATDGTSVHQDVRSSDASTTGESPKDATCSGEVFAQSSCIPPPVSTLLPQPHPAQMRVSGVQPASWEPVPAKHLFNIITCLLLVWKLCLFLLGQPRAGNAGTALLLLAIQAAKTTGATKYSGWHTAVFVSKVVAMLGGQISSGILLPHSIRHHWTLQANRSQAIPSTATASAICMLDVCVTTFLMLHINFGISGARDTAVPAAFAWCLASAALTLAVDNCSLPAVMIPKHARAAGRSADSPSRCKVKPN